MKSSTQHTTPNGWMKSSNASVWVTNRNEKGNLKNRRKRLGKNCPAFDV